MLIKFTQEYAVGGDDFDFDFVEVDLSVPDNIGFDIAYGRGFLNARPNFKSLLLVVDASIYNYVLNYEDQGELFTPGRFSIEFNVYPTILEAVLTDEITGRVYYLAAAI